ncbi:MAG: hypothetical protein A2900_01235 [Candidatus Chisholmbacteria bacterium RIFCSPLOWO2_01_FULL_50_28]|uniref:HPr kinase/phosphorylase C-terminal domain-containing protein n=1 Tax=Candidatus Chisholmbacteria bacterium RIFCSPHIGHO2_01_FULL_52_32 TaxID=1797591 RepID=A0A1G1VVA8_9BACT|nr:MAG: hypothetical protein A2786_06295 [Candidatus Chisholmbacteria bacterium RIFCSPHIGHO2_01_FULL_52_32]OGY19712.1 MAG: hypothetical protein A2900_01235 [Candidatus Chisholmbacteria bacterium RIFCSPLOWO2_01_FULL_50_28]
MKTIFDVADLQYRVRIPRIDRRTKTYLFDRYGQYIGHNKKEAVGEIVIHLSHRKRFQSENRAKGLKALEKRGTLYVTHKGIYAGTIDLIHRKGEFHCFSVSALNTILKLFTSLCVLFKRGLVLHASAIVIKGKAFVFVGKQGVGKSTIARLSGGNIIADDTSFIVPSNRVFYVHPTPFDKNLELPNNSPAPLQKCIYISHKLQNDTFERLRSRDMPKLLIDHIRPDMDFFRFSPLCLNEIFTSIINFVASFEKFYILDFSKSDNFLDLILHEPSAD